MNSLSQRTIYALTILLFWFRTCIILFGRVWEGLQSFFVVWRVLSAKPTLETNTVFSTEQYPALFKYRLVSMSRSKCCLRGWRWGWWVVEGWGGVGVEGCGGVWGWRGGGGVGAGGGVGLGWCVCVWGGGGVSEGMAILSAFLNYGQQQFAWLLWGRICPTENNIEFNHSNNSPLIIVTRLIHVQTTCSWYR